MYVNAAWQKVARFVLPQHVAKQAGLNPIPMPIPVISRGNRLLPLAIFTVFAIWQTVETAGKSKKKIQKLNSFPAASAAANFGISQASKFVQLTVGASFPLSLFPCLACFRMLVRGV